MNKQTCQLKNLIEEMIAAGNTDKEIANEMTLHPDLMPNLIAIIRKLDADLTAAYEEAAGESL